MVLLTGEDTGQDPRNRVYGRLLVSSYGIVLGYNISACFAIR